MHGIAVSLLLQAVAVFAAMIAALASILNAFHLTRISIQVDGRLNELVAASRLKGFGEGKAEQVMLASAAADKAREQAHADRVEARAAAGAPIASDPAAMPDVQGRTDTTGGNGA